MRTKMPYGISVGVEYELYKNLTISYSFKHFIRNFYIIDSDINYLGEDKLKFTEAYEVGFLGLRNAFFRNFLFCQSNSLSIQYNKPIFGIERKYFISFSGGVSLDDYEIGQSNEDRNSTYLSTHTAYNNNNFKEFRIYNKTTINQNNPGKFGREVSMLLSVGIMKKFKRGQTISLFAGYKWSIPAFRLKNNYLYNDLNYYRYAQDREGHEYVTETYHGTMKFPISMTGLYGGLSYSFKLFD